MLLLSKDIRDGKWLGCAFVVVQGLNPRPHEVDAPSDSHSPSPGPSPGPSPRVCIKMRTAIITYSPEDVGECLKCRGRCQRKKVWVMGQGGQRVLHRRGSSTAA